MSWRRLAAFLVGGGLVVGGALTANPVLVTSGVGVLGVATNAEKWLGKKAKAEPQGAELGDEPTDPGSRRRAR